MDRRKSKLNNIAVQFNAIIDETTVLKENIEHVINQVFSCVDYIKQTSEDMGQKTTEILKYELDLLTKLVDMNYMMENIWDMNLTDKWNIPVKLYRIENNLQNHMVESKKQCSGVHLPDLEIMETNNEDNPVEHSSYQNGVSSRLLNPVPHNNNSHPPTAHSVPSAGEVIVNSQNSHSRIADTQGQQYTMSENHSSAVVEVISNSMSDQSSHSGNEEASQSNIQILRQQLKLFNEKLGISSIAFSDMEDHYKKSSLESSLLHPSHQYENPDAQQIPERDTGGLAKPTLLKMNSTHGLNPFIRTGVEIAPSCSDLSEISTDISNSNGRDENICPTNAGKMDVVGQSCSYDAKPQKCPTFDSEPIINDFDSSLAVSGNAESSSNQHCVDTIEKSTALKKLNNYEVRRKEEIKAVPVELKHIPDISLKPTKSDNIPEYITEDIDFPKKAKTKRNKNMIRNTPEKINYNLRAKQTPKVGDRCVFSHIESPSEFYLHIVDEETAAIDKLNDKIDTLFKGTSSIYKTKEDACSDIGIYCCAYIRDYNSWYRVSMLDWKLNELEDVHVKLVDYGNTRFISYKHLRKLTKELSEIPMFAVRCHLPLMYPPGSTNLHRLSEWSPESKEALWNLSGALEGTRSVEFKLVYVEIEPDSIAVDLQNPVETTDQDTVGQVLLNLGYAVQLVDTLDEDNLDLEEFLQDTETLGLADNVNEAVMGYDPRDEARICRFTKSDGTCFKGKHCKLDHTLLPQDGFTTDKEFVFREAFYQLGLPSPKETVNLLITGYINPCRFYAHVVRNPQRESNYTMDKDLFDLEKVMNADRMVRTYETFKISPAVGEIVLVKDWTQKFRRAVVREVKFANNGGPLTAQVFTLDFGETLTIDMVHVRKMNPQFLQLPFQTIECYISDYKATTKCNAEVAKDFFDRNLYFQNFFAYVMSSFLPLAIELKSLNGLNIGTILETNNLAEKRLCDNNPLGECFLDFY